jgi:hypothetical protein
MRGFHRVLRHTLDVLWDRITRHVPHGRILTIKTHAARKFFHWALTKETGWQPK